MVLAFHLEEILRHLDHQLNHCRHHRVRSLHSLDRNVAQDHSELHAACFGHLGLC